MLKSPAKIKLFPLTDNLDPQKKVLFKVLAGRGRAVLTQLPQICTVKSIAQLQFKSGF